MEISLDISKKNFEQFKQICKEKNIEPDRLISLLLYGYLKIDNIKLKEEKSLSIFDYFEAKMKKYKIDQNSLAKCIGVARVTIAQSFSRKSNNSILYKEAMKRKDELLVCAYINKNKKPLEPVIKEILINDYKIDNKHLLFIETLYGVINSDIKEFPTILFKILDEGYFDRINIDKLFNNVDNFIETIYSIIEEYFTP